MDYSSSLHDDNPAGASPWGASPVASPQHPRTSPYPGSSDGPSSPTPYSTHSSGTGFSNDETMASEGRNGPQEGDSSNSLNASEGHRPDTADSSIQPQEHQQQFTGQQDRPEQQRGHPSGRQAQEGQEPQGPQYKLQAKITGLERTGRKDPILRFDVHVSAPCVLKRSRLTS